jgi:predicted nucleic acid-binding protein
MPLAIPAGQTVFLDSTILHYAFVSFPDATARCIDLLGRIAKGEVSAHITVPVLNDAVHKIMCSEAKQRFDRPRAGLVAWLKANPDAVRQLTHAEGALRLVAALPIELLPVDTAMLLAAQQIARTRGLLASDALIVAAMQHHEIMHLATNDDDFDPIPGLTIWKPR